MNLNLTSTITMPEHRLRREVIQLCQTTGKPILKLSTKDYLEHNMMHWVNEFGSAGLVNIEVFNQLQHTITPATPYGFPPKASGSSTVIRPEGKAAASSSARVPGYKSPFPVRRYASASTASQSMPLSARVTGSFSER